MKNFNKTLLATLLFTGCTHLVFAELTGSAGQLIGTLPVLKGTGGGAADHSVSFSNGHESGSAQAMSPGDKISLKYVFSDSEGDTDSSKTSIKWFTSTDGHGANKVALDNDGKDTYTITPANAGLYLGAEITEQTSTGIPNKGQTMVIDDISANDPADDIPDGPVVGGAIGVMIVDSSAPTVNLIGKADSQLLVGHTYQFKIWYDANNNQVWDAGELDAANNYGYRWFFGGTSATTGTTGGYAVTSTDNKDLVVPATNASAKTIFATAGADGVQGYSLKVDYTAKLKSIQKPRK